MKIRQQKNFKMQVPFNIIKYITDNGKEYDPHQIPEGILDIRGEVGDCYDTCLLAVVKYPHLRYVEGLARNPLTGEWILHAWVTDEDDKLAFDLTWKAVNKETKQEIFIPTTYIGVQMNTKLVVEFVKTTEYKGVFANHFRNPDLMKRLLINK